MTNKQAQVVHTLESEPQRRCYELLSLSNLNFEEPHKRVLSIAKTMFRVCVN